MSLPKRLILWAGDGPLNARDQVADEIGKYIDESIAECDEDDTCWLNEVIAYMCCLSAIGHSYGGLTCQYERIEGWRKKVLQIHDWAWASRAKNKEFKEERKYICSVLNALFEGADKSTVQEAREPWKKC